MKNNFVTLIFIFFAGLTTNVCAQPYEDEFAEYEAEFSKKNQVEIYDPFEKVNRKIFTFNDFLDRYLIEHIAQAYHDYTPKFLRKSIRNFATNLTSPISAINSFLQGKVDNGLATSSHFLINSTLGIGGLFDIAGDKNIRYEKEDFGQTFGHYGAKSGPFLMLPIFGPSTVRDLTGSTASVAIDPLGFNILQIGGSANAISTNTRLANTTIYNLDLRESLLTVLSDARKDSFDLYATIRSVYIQQRDSDIQK